MFPNGCKLIRKITTRSLLGKKGQYFHIKVTNLNPDYPKIRYFFDRKFAK